MLAIMGDMRKSKNTLKKYMAILMCSAFGLTSCGKQTDLRFLETATDRLTVRGTICTESPREISNPVRILFLVDTSGSMGPHGTPQQPGNDPNGLRADAVEAVIDRFIDIENYKYGIIDFDSSAKLETAPEGFTRDRSILDPAIEAVRDANGGTDQGAAIELATSTIVSDVQQMIEDGENPSTAKYVLVQISDGQPDIIGATEAELKTKARQAIDSLKVIQETLDIGSIFYHSGFLGDDANGRAFMAELVARFGNGVAIEFAKAEEIDFLEENLNFAPLTISRSLVDIYVNNRNAMSENINSSQASIVADSDGDGLSDIEEQLLGTNPLLRDTDGDDISDRTEYIRSLNPLIPDSICTAENPEEDEDRDGVSNCDESVYLTDRNKVDTDGDGMIELLETLYGTDPRISDAALDTDNDGMDNISELKRGLNPSVDDQNLRDEFAYDYSISFVEINEEGNFCYDIVVGGIKLVETMVLAGDTSPKNTIEIYLQTRYTDGSDEDVFLKASQDINLDEYFSNLEDNTFQLESLEFIEMGKED